MAMIHPDDQDFSKTEPVKIAQISILFETRLGMSVDAAHVSAPSSTQGQFHKLYFISLLASSTVSQGKEWVGKNVVLRIARPFIESAKVQNEVACIEAARRAGIAVPRILFFSASTQALDNSLGYEYICMERVNFPSLEDTWMTMSDATLSHVLQQLVRFHVLALTSLDTIISNSDAYGSLRVALPSGSVFEADVRSAIIKPGPVLEETMWSVPDVQRYFHAAPYSLTEESVQTLNPSAAHGYADYPAYVAAFLSAYIHVIRVHPNAGFLKHILPALDKVVAKLETPGTSAEPWIQQLREKKELKGHFWHRDVHFGNILVDPESGEWKAVLDWEFAGLGPCFQTKTTDPLAQTVYRLSQIPETAPEYDRAQETIKTWPSRFSELLRAESSEAADLWTSATDRDNVLGPEGNALSDLREFLRSCLEVGIRGWGSVEAAKGRWREVVESRLQALGCM